jgi:hypothetical protein
VGTDVWLTLAATWPFLVLSFAAAAALNVYVGAERMGGWLRRRAWVAVLGAVALASATPFCSCGTTAVTLGMIASSTPWAPIVAFMVASPLTSPSELVLSGALLGWPFALLFFVGTIVLGLASGAIAGVLQRAGWLEGQARMAGSACGTSCAPTAPTTMTAPTATSTPALSMGPGAAAITEFGHAPHWAAEVTSPPLSPPTSRHRDFLRELRTTGKRMAVFFLGFTTLSYLLIELIPTVWLQDWLGGDGIRSVVAAAILGIPAYVNTEGSLPLLAGLTEGGMSPGAAMAFLVTGAGTSIGAVTGMLLVARRRVVGLTVAILFAGAIAMGTVPQLILG